jgi:hypothetical protein
MAVPQKKAVILPLRERSAGGSSACASACSGAICWRRREAFLEESVTGG